MLAQFHFIEDVGVQLVHLRCKFNVAFVVHQTAIETQQAVAQSHCCSRVNRARYRRIDGGVRLSHKGTGENDGFFRIHRQGALRPVIAAGLGAIPIGYPAFGGVSVGIRRFDAGEVSHQAVGGTAIALCLHESCGGEIKFSQFVSDGFGHRVQAQLVFRFSKLDKLLPQVRSAGEGIRGVLH